MSLQFCLESLALLAKAGLDPVSLTTSVPRHQQPEYIAALMYLTDCTEEGESPPNVFIQNAVEACSYLCEIEAWEPVRQILLTPLHPTLPDNLDELLNDWRFDHEQIKLYSLLSGKFDQSMEAILLRGLGDAFNHLVDNQHVQAYFEQSRTLFRATGAALEAAQLLYRLGTFSLHNEGNFPKAKTYLQEALIELRFFKDYKTLTQVLNNLAQISVQQGAYDEARRYYTESLDIHVQHLSADTLLRAWFYQSIGQCFRHQGEFGNAAHYLRQSLRVFHQQEHFAGIVWTLMEWSSLLAAQAKYLATRALLRYLLNQHDTTHPGPLVAWAYHLSGRLDLKVGDYAQAYDVFQKTLRIQQTLGHQVGIIYALDGVACALVHLQQFVPGMRLLGIVGVLCKQQQLVFPPFDRADSEQSLAILRTNLDPSTFTTNWHDGQCLSREEAIAEALSIRQVATIEGLG